MVIFENHAYLVCYPKMPYAAHLISMVSVPMVYRLRHCRWETMLRTCPRGWSAIYLAAAYVLSMVFDCGWMLVQQV